MPTIAVTGAAGKTGTAVRQALADRECDVVPIVHRSKGFPGERVAAFEDRSALSDALSGIDAVYLIAPNVHPDEPGLLAPALAACDELGVRVVYHSVMHPYSPRMPHHLDKARVEDALHRSDLDWTILQPASYADNVLAQLDGVGADGAWPVPYDVTREFTPIALRDLAAVAALVLTETGHASATYEVAGPGRISSEGMAAAASAILERPIVARRDRAGWRAGAEGLAADARDRLERMFDYYDDHGFCGGGLIAERLLGRPLVTFDDWLQDALVT